MSAGRRPVPETVAQWAVAALLLLVTLAFFNSRGTGDVRIWLRWAGQAESLGLVPGFAANQADYPPLATVVSWLAVRLGGVLALPPLQGIKLVILLAHLGSTLVVFRWTRSLPLALAFHASVFLNAIAQGSLDIAVALPLLLSLWALRKGRLMPFSVLFTLAVLLKWQPLITAPFVAAHVVATTRRPSGEVDVGALVTHAIAPGLALLAIVALMFGVGPTIDAFSRGMNHEALSANALNANWIVTHLLRAFDPNFGGLEAGRANWIETAPAGVLTAARLAFMVVYGFTFFVYLRREKTFDQLLKFAMLGCLSYFMLNAGVHENHLFLAALLAVLLVWLKPEALWPALVIVLMSNINLLIFGGIDGDELPFKRVIAERYDMALPIAVVNVAFFCWYWTSEVMDRNQWAATVVTEKPGSPHGANSA